MHRSLPWAVFGLLALPAPSAAQQALGRIWMVEDVGALYRGSPRVAYNSAHDESLVVWQDCSDVFWTTCRIRARRMNRYGRPRAASFQVDAGTHGAVEPAVAYDAVHDRYLVVYSYDYYGDSSDWDLRARFLRWDGIDPSWPEFDVATSGDDELRASIAYSYLSDKFLVAWQRGSTPYSSIWAARFGFGEPPTSFAVAATGLPIAWPDVAYQPFGDNFLVVYEYGQNIFGNLVAADDGTVGPEIEIAAWPNGEWFPRVASCGNWQYLVTWHSQVDSGTANHVYARYLNGDGSLGGAPIQVSSSPYHDQFASVSCLSEETPGYLSYVVVHQRHIEDNPTAHRYGIFGRRLSIWGLPGPEFEVESPTVSIPYQWQLALFEQAPSVAGGSTGWYVVWPRVRPGGAWVSDIMGRPAWELFSDGFEWASTLDWSFASP